jgi:hypothetical protein
MGAHVLSIVIVFLAYSMLDLGKAFQKLGLAAMGTRRWPCSGWLALPSRNFGLEMNSTNLQLEVALHRCQIHTKGNREEF